MSKTVRKTVRIYRQHDLDLYSLGLSKSYHLGREMKKALIAYANNTTYDPPELPKTLDDSVVRTSMLLILYFDPSKPEEKKALDVLNEIKYGYGCPFIKALFRSSLTETLLSSYYADNGLQMSNAEVVRSIQKKQKAAVLSNLSGKKEISENKFQTENDGTVTSFENSIYKEPLQKEDSETIDTEDTETNEDLNDFFKQMDLFTH